MNLLDTQLADLNHLIAELRRKNVGGSADAAINALRQMAAHVSQHGTTIPMIVSVKALDLMIEAGAEPSMPEPSIYSGVAYRSQRKVLLHEAPVIGLIHDVPFVFDADARAHTRTEAE